MCSGLSLELELVNLNWLESSKPPCGASSTRWRGCVETTGRSKHWAKSSRYLKEIVLRAIAKLARAFGHDLIFHLSLVISHLPFRTSVKSSDFSKTKIGNENEKLSMENSPSFEPQSLPTIRRNSHPVRFLK